MANWGFLTSHARVLLCIAHDPGARLRDIAASLGITERSAYGIVTELAEAGYVVKQKDGRRNRYQIQAHLPLPEPASRERTVGEILALLAGTDATPWPAGGTHESRRKPGTSPPLSSRVRPARPAPEPCTTGSRRTTFMRPDCAGRAVACRCRQARQHALPAEYSQLRP